MGSKRRASSEGGLRAVRLVERMLREVCLRCGTGTYHPASLPASSCLLLLPPPPPPASRVLLAVFFFVRVANLEAWATHAKLRPRMLSRNRVQGNIGPLLSSSQKGDMLSCAMDSA